MKERWQHFLLVSYGVTSVLPIWRIAPMLANCRWKDAVLIKCRWWIWKYLRFFRQIEYIMKRKWIWMLRDNWENFFFVLVDSFSICDLIASYAEHHLQSSCSLTNQIHSNSHWNRFNWAKDGVFQMLHYEWVSGWESFRQCHYNNLRCCLPPKKNKKQNLCIHV